ncbi:MAG: cytochrome c biogenesis protein CcsA, partial [Phycisphaeraceae bacterium]
MFAQMLKGLASLKLTVVLLSLAMALIFVGTLAQAHMGVWQAVETFFRSPVAWIELRFLIPETVGRVPGRVPFPGGLLIGALLLINLVAAHAVRFRLSVRRIGVLMLHAGLIVLIVGEFVTGWLAEEGLMSIDVGQSVRYIEDIRATELAVIDPSDAEVDRVVSVPGSLVREYASRDAPLADPRLPFEIEVVRWLDNARLQRAQTRPAAAPHAADQGVGREAIAEQLPPARGVDANQVNAPAAYVRLHREGEVLGTWLLWAHLVEAQRVEVEGQTYGIALRYKRTYMPYELHLLAFNHDKFVGTEIPRNFESHIRLVDTERGTNREVRIWMNNPLRYRGSTFYQSSYKPDGSGTVLQVVTNPGAALPYVACVLVAGGMVWHFVWGMVDFLRRRTRGAARKRDEALHEPASRGRLALPWLVGAAGLALACSGLFRSAPGEAYDLDTFARLPVTAGGRLKPMDSAARHALMVASGRRSVRTDEQRMGATPFLVGLMARPEAVRDLPVVRVDHPDVLSLLDRRPEEGGRFSLRTIEPHWSRITEHAQAALDLDAKQRDPFQRQVVKLYHGVSTLLAHARMREPYVIPPLGRDGQWQSFHEAFLESGLAQPEGHPGRPRDASEVHPAVAHYIAIMTAYTQQDPEAFNRHVAEYDALLRDQMPGVMRRMDIEVNFNRVAPFLGATVVYAVAFVLLCLSMLLRLRQSTHDDGRGAPAMADGLRVSAVALVCAALIVHTLAILLRIYLQGRPPVTNLYSSAVFVGWASVLLGIALERLYPIGMAALGAAVVGFTTLIVAHNLGSDGDTMQMMQAVLDSNFWLATHVTTITLGYSAMFLAGALAIVYILLGVFTRMLTASRAEGLTRMVYGVICFALLLSFVGTVLGGIWADQSWGRFWGWDPKENGAALIVLINAVILHARWGGMIRQRGMMVLAVGGNIVTAWSWFGTNMLGIGLH